MMRNRECMIVLVYPRDISCACAVIDVLALPSTFLPLFSYWRHVLAPGMVTISRHLYSSDIFCRSMDTWSRSMISFGRIEKDEFSFIPNGHSLTRYPSRTKERARNRSPPTNPHCYHVGYLSDHSTVPSHWTLDHEIESNPG